MYNKILCFFLVDLNKKRFKNNNSNLMTLYGEEILSLKEILESDQKRVVQLNLDERL